MIERVAGLVGLAAAARDTASTVELELSCSVRELARERAAFEQVLAELAARGRRVRLGTIALTTLSGPEGREDKFSTQALIALRNSFELEARFPGTFCFRGHARFDTVLRTDLDLRVVRTLGLYEEFGIEPDALAEAGGARHVTVRGDLRSFEACERARDLAVREHFKPIHRPTIAPEKLADVLAELHRRFGPEISHASTPHDAHGSAIDLVYGIDEAEVHEFVELARRSNLEISPDDRDAINRRIGELLGYPACCVDAFLRAAPTEEDVTERTLIARRIGQGRLDPRWPLLLIVYEHYLPCSLHCERSLALAERIERTLIERGVEPPDGGWGRLVFLGDLEQPGNVAVLLRGSADARGFDYRVVALNSDAPVLAPLAAGERLEFDAQTTTVLRDGAAIHTWAGNVAVFDVEREWGDSEWFRAYFEAQLAAATPTRATHEPESEPTSERIDVSFPITAEQARALLERTCPPGVRVIQCEARRVGAAEWIQARLDGELGEFPITIIPRANEIHGVAAQFDRNGRVSEQRSLLRGLAEQLDGRATTPLPGRELALGLELVGLAAQPDSGEFQTFAGFAACVPICERGGDVRLALAAHGEVLELIVAPRRGRESWPGKSSRCAVAHADTQLRGERARAAFARFVQHLRAVDRG
jgi:hypothetical protein